MAGEWIRSEWYNSEQVFAVSTTNRSTV
jgi:hypothetical protein